MGASITLHFIFAQRPDTPVRFYPSLLIATSDIGQNHCQSCETHAPSSQLSTYILARNTQNLTLAWQKKNEDHQDRVIKIEEDGNYFLFLKVTLQSRKQGVNYTVTVQKMPDGNSASDIIVGHINGTEYSTGFMGIGVHLSESTKIHVTCNPPQQLDVLNTYLGLIKF
ncbi:hypothetical protein QTP70_031665 [Hemibagrus guttatus]|uniref:THD domain-containing protein n=1 Tax=Hemibagrus guttatus TaxID=175788 RepID=A0AAE0UPB6_9TELE|nr:hypothetical protein QTP70_031665 [Hemibagrus guttatus]